MILEAKALYKQFPGRNSPAVDGLDLSISAGEIYALVGESGCGKSTTFRMIAGLLDPDSGTIRIRNREVFGNSQSLSCEERRVGMVFQNAALFPHLNLEKNVSFGLRGTRSEKQRLARRYLEQVGLELPAGTYPHELSGGQQQRVALARALAMQPDLILLDEPFSNLDVRIKARVIEQMRGILQEAGTTTILVTHDINEAFHLAGRIGVMRSGALVQEGTPAQLYHHPANEYVADFLGTANSLGTKELHTILPGTLDIPPDDTFILRPEEFEIEPVEIQNHKPANGEVAASTFLGPFRELVVKLADGREHSTVRVRTTADEAPQPGSSVRLSLKPEALERLRSSRA